MIILALLVLLLAAALGVLAIKRRRKGLRLPPPIPSQAPVHVGPPPKEQLKEIKRIAQGKRQFMLRPGYVWNPMRNYPRNARCTCLSGKKFKACCLNHIPDAIPEDRAKRVAGLVELAHQGVDVPLAIAKARHQAARDDEEKRLLHGSGAR